MGIEQDNQDKGPTNSMNLKNFRNDPLDLPESNGEENLQSSEYYQEINNLKIEKLSNRVTIISVILPCLICAILIFFYLDMKERVVDVDMTKKLQVEKLAQQVEEKWNALDLRIAKNKFNFDQQLPLVTKKEQALANQVAKMSVSKADVKTIKSAMAELDKKIKKNTGQSKSNLLAMKADNQKLQTLVAENKTQFKKETNQLQEETNQLQQDITLSKEDFDAKLLEIAGYDKQIKLLQKSIGLLDKKLKEMDLNKISKQDLDKSFNQVRLSLKKMIQDLDTKLEQQEPDKLPVVKKKSSDTKFVPQSDMGNIKSEGISEEPLTQ
ncbi:MAG: hypothetical protein GY710_26105 [Desulfobacteraceae bacterium]|nr:hypothetical protein [Desulfobacteraceae bacterium]